jgi:cysteine synthase
MIHDSILGTIGNTPIVRINKLAPANKTLYVKCEAFNPMSSVKDRLAIAMIEDAERRGVLKKGMTVLEPTSGNTGIALAMVCAVKGYQYVAVMADSFSVERRKLMKFLGAKVILTPAAARGSGMVKKCEELVKEYGWFMPQQFDNPANPEYHRNTTGPEILRDFAGKRLDAFVSGIGTGGTITGVGEVIKARKPGFKCIAVEPDASAVLSGSPKGPHVIQGIGAGFIPDILNREIYDEIVRVPNDAALDTARRLAKEEGLFVGISSGAAVWAALQVGKRNENEGKLIVAVLPSFGERYLTSPLYAGLMD